MITEHVHELTQSSAEENFLLKIGDPLTSMIKTGTSNSDSITVANFCPEPIPIMTMARQLPDKSRCLPQLGIRQRLWTASSHGRAYYY